MTQTKSGEEDVIQEPQRNCRFERFRSEDKHTNSSDKNQNTPHLCSFRDLDDDGDDENGEEDHNNGVGDDLVGDDAGEGGKIRGELSDHNFSETDRRAMPLTILLARPRLASIDVVWGAKIFGQCHYSFVIKEDHPTFCDMRMMVSRWLSRSSSDLNPMASAERKNKVHISATSNATAPAAATHRSHLPVFACCASFLLCGRASRGSAAALRGRKPASKEPKLVWGLTGCWRQTDENQSYRGPAVWPAEKICPALGCRLGIVGDRRIINTTEDKGSPPLSAYRLALKLRQLVLVARQAALQAWPLARRQLLQRHAHAVEL